VSPALAVRYQLKQVKFAEYPCTNITLVCKGGCFVVGS
jgi:hypothetical protein